MHSVVLLADAFMVAMISRPPSGTLRTTWVTPGTVVLCAVLAILGMPLGIVGFLYAIASGEFFVGAGSIAVLVLALGSSAVLAVAIAQRTASA